MALDFATLEAAVQHESDVDDGVQVLLQKLSDEIKALAANAQDPADQQKLNDLAAKLTARSGALADAVVANTPASPAA